MTPDVHAADAYRILGVARQASLPAIRSAFRRLALCHHPDVVPADQKAEAARIFARIAQAYEVLRDAEKRREYDQALNRGLSPDLAKAAGSVSVIGLEEILAAIETLHIPDIAAEELPELPAEMYHWMQPNLIRTESVTERVFDVLYLTGAEGKSSPRFGDRMILFTHFLVTNLRILLVDCSYETGDKIADWRLVGSIDYSSVILLAIDTFRGAQPRHILELQSADGWRINMEVLTPSFYRVFLVANAYGLPLRIRTHSLLRPDLIAAALTSLALAFLLFVGTGMLLISIGDRLLGSRPSAFTPVQGPGGVPGPGISHAVSLSHDDYEQLVAVISAVVALVPFLLSVRRLAHSYLLGRPEAIIGETAVDFADGVPEAPPLPEETVTPAVLQPRRPERLAPEPAPAAEPPAGPIVVEMPEAVREALGLPPERRPSPGKLKG